MTSVRERLCAFQGARTLLQFLLGIGMHVMTGVMYASMYQGKGRSGGGVGFSLSRRVFHCLKARGKAVVSENCLLRL